MSDNGNAPLQPSPFWQDGKEYHGVLALAHPHRLAISPNGKRYLLQKAGQFEGREIWGVVKWRKLLPALLPDLPGPVLLAMPEGLPDDPQDYARPWASAMKAQGQRVRRALPHDDAYSGEVWRQGDVRLVVSQTGTSYGAQIRRGRRWDYVARASLVPKLRLLIERALSPDCAASILEQLDSMPERARDFSGPAVETIDAAARLPGGERPLRGVPRDVRPARRAGGTSTADRKAPQTATDARQSGKAG